MQTFSKILVSLFVINAILIQNLVGLSVSEMVLEDIKPSFDCEAKNLTTSEMEMCDGIGMIPPSYFAIIDNFYASYYNAVIKRIKSNDKTTIKQISLQMIKERGKVCPNTTFDEAYNSSLNSELSAQCYYYAYSKAFREITQFIYNTPAYKPIFEKIFYPNPQAYYKLITTIKPNNSKTPFDDNAEMIFEVIDKAAKDNLVDKNGALIGDSQKSIL